MKEILKSKQFIIPALTIAILYVLMIAYLMNFRLTKDTLFGNYPISYKMELAGSTPGRIRDIHD